VKAKNNLAPDKHALRFFVGTQNVGNDPDTGAIWAPHVLWHNEHVEVTATEAMEAAEGGGSRRASRKEAEEFLREKLAHGPVPAIEIEEEAKARLISVSGALRRARKDLGVKVSKERGRTDGGWFWELPQGPRYEAG
jgi:hypothetical protein